MKFSKLFCCVSSQRESSEAASRSSKTSSPKPAGNGVFDMRHISRRHNDLPSTSKSTSISSMVPSYDVSICEKKEPEYSTSRPLSFNAAENSHHLPVSFVGLDSLPRNDFSDSSHTSGVHFVVQDDVESHRCPAGDIRQHLFENGSINQSIVDADAMIPVASINQSTAVVNGERCKKRPRSLYSPAAAADYHRMHFYHSTHSINSTSRFHRLLQPIDTKKRNLICHQPARSINQSMTDVNADTSRGFRSRPRSLITSESLPKLSSATTNDLLTPEVLENPEALAALGYGYLPGHGPPLPPLPLDVILSLTCRPHCVVSPQDLEIHEMCRSPSSNTSGFCSDTFVGALEGTEFSSGSASLTSIDTDKTLLNQPVMSSEFSG